MKLLNFGKKKRKDAFEALIEEQLDALFGAALRYTRNRHHAEDLVHDTVVKALRFRHRFEYGTNFRAWIFTILTHTFIHKYRRGKKERQILEGASQQDVSQRLSSTATREQLQHPENHYLDQMLSDDVLQALDELPEEYRSVVVLCDIEGLSYKDIAEAIGLPVGTVMSRLYRGRRALEGKLYKTAVEQGIVRGVQEVTPDEKSDAAKTAEERTIVDFINYRRRRRA